MTEIDREQQAEQSEIEDAETYKPRSTADITGSRDREQQTERNNTETENRKTSSRDRDRKNRKG